MIETIQIENFKAVQNETFHLSQFNIFVGENNSGKSSVLQAIQFAVGSAQTGKRLARNIVSNPIKYTANASSFVYLPIRDIEALIHNRELTQLKGAHITFFDGENEAKIELKRGKNRNITVTMSNSPLLVQIMSQQPYCVFTPGVSGISVREEFKTKAAVLKSATRGDSNFYLRNILLLLKRNEDSWEKFNEKFHIFFPEYMLHVDFNEDIDEDIEVYATLPNDVQLPIDALGTSALQILQILSYIYCFDPQMIILDEPDTHLHPNNQRKLIATLNEICQEQNLQILLSTHSRHMIDEGRGIASFFWMQHGKLCNEFSVENTADFVQVMLDLGALDKSDFLNNPQIEWIICTEDARVEKEKMLNCILEASGANLNKCVIIPYNGCGKIENVILFSSFVHGFLPEAKILVHRDRDYLSDDEIANLQSKMERNSIYFWATPSTDIESIFINADHIHTLFPELQQETIEKIIALARNRTRENSIEKFVNYVANSSDCRNYRDINRRCEQEYDNNPGRYSYGKKTLGLIKNDLQPLLHCVPNLYIATPAIKQSSLESYFGEQR